MGEPLRRSREHLLRAAGRPSSGMWRKLLPAQFADSFDYAFINASGAASQAGRTGDDVVLPSL